MKYRRWLAFALALCLMLPLAACNLKPAAPWPEVLKPGARLVRGSGNVVEVKTPLSGDAGGFALRMKGISLRTSIHTEVELVIDESLPREVVVTADDNVAECVSVKYDAATGEITVDMSRSLVISPSRLRIAVGAPVKALDINGAWDFTYDCPGVRDCGITVNGACDGECAFGALDSLRVQVNGASDITLKGAAKRADFTINGAADISAFGLAAEDAFVALHGAGSCELTATGTLDVEINGVGDVTYAGHPKVSKRIHGVGEVRAK